jgi:hypothetical protein
MGASTGAGTPSLAARRALVAAIVVLIGGIAAALVKDEPSSDKSRTGSTTTTRAATTSTAASTTSPSSIPIGTSSTSTTGRTTTTGVTAPPAVATPEAAANGLFAAYRAGDQQQAARFATAEVVEVLFRVAFSGDEGTFQGCAPDGQLFVCRVAQVGAAYTMTVQRTPGSGSFIVVGLDVQSTGQTTTTPPSTSSEPMATVN